MVSKRRKSVIFRDNCALSRLHSLRSSLDGCALSRLHSLRSSLDGCALPRLHSLRSSLDGCALSRLHSLRSSLDGCALSRLHSLRSSLDGCALSRLHSLRSLMHSDFILCFFLRRRGRRWRRILFCVSRTAIFVEEIIDPRARAFQGTDRGRNINLQKLQLIRGLRAFVHLNPNAGLFRYHLALSHICSPAWPISELLRTGLRANILHVRQDAIPARLTAERWGLDGKLCAF